MIYVFNENKDFDTQVQYVFDTLFRILGLNVKYIDNIRTKIQIDDLLIYYGRNFNGNCSTIQITPSYLFSEDYMKENSMPKLPLKKYKETPVIYVGDSSKQPYVFKTSSKITTNLDIIQSSFFMLTGYEEFLSYSKLPINSHSRFEASNSLAYKENFLSKPIVNEYIEWLWQWISSFYLGYKRRNWWGHHDFCAFISHDIDLLDKPYWTFNYIVSLLNKYEFKSSFYFMSGGTTNYDNNYKISSPEVVSMIQNLYASQFEVGFHGSYNSYDNFDQMKIEKEELDIYNPSKVYGTRQHYLRFEFPTTWNIQNKLGLLYDSTLTYSEQIGFRCGICMPFKAFDLIENEELDIYEIPLIIMDATLAAEKYMNLNKSQSINEIKHYVDIVRNYGGVFSLLWHNSSLNTGFWDGWKEVFEASVGYINESGGIGKTGKDIIRHFNFDHPY